MIHLHANLQIVSCLLIPKTSCTRIINQYIHPWFSVNDVLGKLAN